MEFLNLHDKINAKPKYSVDILLSTFLRYIQISLRNHHSNGYFIGHKRFKSTEYVFLIANSHESMQVLLKIYYGRDIVHVLYTTKGFQMRREKSRHHMTKQCSFKNFCCWPETKSSKTCFQLYRYEMCPYAQEQVIYMVKTTKISPHTMFFLFFF